jgi:hypothetical protein
MKLLNAVSLSMFTRIGGAFNIKAERVSAKRAKELLTYHGLESCIGHKDAAAMCSSLLGMPVPENRVSTVIGEQEQAVVFQYMGPRLPEGVINLPEGAKVAFFHIKATESTGRCFYCHSEQGMDVDNDENVDDPMFVCPSCAYDVELKLQELEAKQ